jgi:hypothetical protein
MRAGVLPRWLAVGLGIGALGHRPSGGERWHLALPTALGLGWWCLADPTRCESRRAGDDDRRPR